MHAHATTFLYRLPPETGHGWCGWSSGGCAGSDGVGIHMWTTNRVTSCETQCLHTSASPAQPDTPAVQLPPTYEEVLSPTPAASIRLKENLSYAHISY